MIKGKVKEEFVIFYVNEFTKDVVDQLELLKQIAGWYGKVARLNNMLFLKPNEDYIGHERKLLKEITDVFQMLWLEYEEIVSNHRNENIKAGE